MLELAMLVALAAEPAATEKAETGTRWVAMDSIALREAPDAKAAKVSDLALGDAVELVGERSAADSTQRLRCRDFTARWVKVKRGDAQGWVFGGALDAKKVEPGPAKWRAVIAFDAHPDAASEDAAFFDEDIEGACKAGKNYFGWADPAKPCAVIGDEQRPLTVVDLSEPLKSQDKTGHRWMTIERNGAQKTVKLLKYEPANRDKAVAFCKGK